MDTTASLSSGVILVRAEASSNYQEASMTENPTHVVGSSPVIGVPTVLTGESTIVVGAPAVVMPPSAAGAVGTKKRGRPRKYGPYGTLAMALSPILISSSAPPPSNGESSTTKQGGVQPIGSENKKRHDAGLENSGNLVACPAAENFIPHMIMVNKGEDVIMKIMSYTEERHEAICVVAATGLVSNATLRQPDPSGGTMTFEGRFHILSLTGSFTHAEVGSSRVSRSGGLSVILGGADGRMFGGMLGGVLLAGGPVQVVVGRFPPDGDQVEKSKKHRMEPNPTPNAPASASVFSHHAREDNNDQRPNLDSPLIHIANWAALDVLENIES